MKRILIYGLMFTACLSCSDKKTSIPEGILSEDEMADVLVDLHIAQAAVGINVVSDSVLYSLDDYAPFIFKNHHTTSAQFDSSLKFYSSNPELLDSIYKEVMEELSKKQIEAEGQGKDS